MLKAKQNMWKRLQNKHEQFHKLSIFYIFANIIFSFIPFEFSNHFSRNIGCTQAKNWSDGLVGYPWFGFIWNLINAPKQTLTYHVECIASVYTKHTYVHKPSDSGSGCMYVCVCIHKFVFECVPIQQVFSLLSSSNGKVFNALAFCSATSLKLHIWLFMFTLAEISAYLCWTQTECWSRIVYMETLSPSRSPPFSIQKGWVDLFFHHIGYTHTIIHVKTVTVACVCVWKFACNANGTSIWV